MTYLASALLCHHFDGSFILFCECHDEKLRMFILRKVLKSNDGINLLISVKHSLCYIIPICNCTYVCLVLGR